MKKNKAYLLDTNVIIELLRNNRQVKQRILEIGIRNCALSVITVYELIFGAYHSGHVEQELAKVREVLERFVSLPLPDAEIYAAQKHVLYSSGLKIDDFDLLIASTALADDLILVTDNLKHFQRIKELKIENWICR